MSQALEVLQPEGIPYEKHTDCLVEYWLAFLGHRWNALILYHLSLGPKRFGALAECLPGASPKVLTERLAGLEERRLIEKTGTGSAPRNGDYALTALGVSLMDILNQLELWSRDAGSGYE